MYHFASRDTIILVSHHSISIIEYSLMNRHSSAPSYKLGICLCHYLGAGFQGGQQTLFVKSMAARCFNSGSIEG